MCGTSIMWTTRRHFISRSALGGLGLAITPLLAAPAGARTGPKVPWPGGKHERIVASECRYYQAYGAEAPMRAEAWIEVDLGSSRRIDAVKLHPASGQFVSGGRDRIQFCFECADHPNFLHRKAIADWQVEDDACPALVPNFRLADMEGRYFRVAATHAHCARAKDKPSEADDFGRGRSDDHRLLKSAHGLKLSEIEILSGSTTIRVTVDRPPNLHCPF